MWNWGRIALLIAVGQVALGLGVMAYAAGNPKGVLAGLFDFVPGALTYLGLRVRWMAIFAIGANVLVAGMSAMWIPGFLLVFLMAGLSAIWKPGDTLARLSDPGAWEIAKAFAVQVAFASTSILSIVALIERDGGRSGSDRGAVLPCPGSAESESPGQG